MKLVSMLAMSAGLVLAPVAQAQISCQHVGHLNEAATDEFDGVVGDETDTRRHICVDLFTGRRRRLPDHRMTCRRPMPAHGSSTALQQPRPTMRAQSRALAECVGAWERSAIDAGSPAEGLNTLEGALVLQHG